MSPIKTLLAGAFLALASTTASAQSYDLCGTLTDNFGSGCTTFLDTNGQQWLPNGSLGGFAIGDTARLQGTIDTSCFNFCFSLAGCIDNPVFSACADYDLCGTLTDNFGSGCTTFLDTNGQQWLLNGSLGTYAIGDTLRVVGTTDTGCFNFCFSLAGCIDNPVLSDCPSPFTSLCFGDGGNQAGCTNCPCSNNAPVGSGGGCLNSAGTGAELVPSGVPSVGADTLHFDLTGAPGNAFCILNSGDNVAPNNPANPCFGMNSGVQAIQFDGLRCAITNTRRHGGRSADAMGDVGLTNNGWGPPNAPMAGIAAQAGFVAGQTRYFQVINRDDPTLSCMRGLNTSQAVEVTFTL